jgi:DNA-binding NarL/FixJ family response regulator
MTATNYILNAIKEKANEGHQLSNKDLQKIIEKIEEIAKDKESFSTLKLILSKNNNEKFENKKNLTCREKEILHQIGHGKDSNSIAKLLNIKVSTIETHRKNIRKKLKLSGNGKLLKFAIINNLKQLVE